MKQVFHFLSVITLFFLMACAPRGYDSGKIDFVTGTPPGFGKAGLNTCTEVLATPSDAKMKTKPAPTQKITESKLILVSSEQVVSIRNLKTKSSARALVKTIVHFDQATGKYVPQSEVSCKDLTQIEEASVDFEGAPIPVVWSAKTHVAELSLNHKISLQNPKLSKEKNKVSTDLNPSTLKFQLQATSSEQATELKNYILTSDPAAPADPSQIPLVTDHKQLFQNGEIEVSTHTRAVFRLEK